MERVATRPGDRIHEAGSAAVDSGVGADRDLELLNRVFAEQVRDAVTTDDVREVVVGGIGAIDGERSGAISVGVSRIFAALLSGNAHQAGVAVVAGIRRQHHEVAVFSSVERQVFDKRTVDDSAGGGILRPQQRRRPDDFNRVVAGSHLQLDILRRGVSYAHLHQDLDIAKALETCHHGIGARRDHWKPVKSRVVCRGGLLHASREVPHNHRRSRYYRPARVGDQTAERARQHHILGSQQYAACQHEQSAPHRQPGDHRNSHAWSNDGFKGVCEKQSGRAFI